MLSFKQQILHLFTLFAVWKLNTASFNHRTFYKKQLWFLDWGKGIVFSKAASESIWDISVYFASWHSELVMNSLGLVVCLLPQSFTFLFWQPRMTGNFCGMQGLVPVVSAVPQVSCWVDSYRMRLEVPLRGTDSNLCSKQKLSPCICQLEPELP